VSAAPLSIPVVLSQHAEEAGFHWLLRDLAVWAPHYDLKDLAKLDGRVEAHLDGLRIAGDEGWALVRDELKWEEPGEVFTATLLALEAGSEERLAEALAVAVTSSELARGAISALGWQPRERAVPWVSRLVRADDPMLRGIAIGGAAVHRHDPGKTLADALLSDDAFQLKRSLKAAGELGRVDLLSHCRSRYASDEDDVRFWAAWSGALLGDPEAIHVLAAVAVAGGPHASRAADLATRRMPLAQAHAWRDLLAGDDAHRRLVVQVAGATGDPAMVPWLLEMMAVEELARPAGEAFSALTGLDLAFEDLEGEWPEGFEAGPTENPEDEDVSLDPDEDLPWPDPALVARWWSANGRVFSAGTRYLCGKPISEAALAEGLVTGFQRQRNAAALELALAQPGRALFETRAPGLVQRRLLRV
jgi:uncharacterized protein (TIGR02270 family)